MIRAALYERVSTEEQAMHGLSLIAQHDALEEYCHMNGMKIIGHYVDEGISAGKPASKRPAMTRLLNDVKADKIDLILFIKLDRWFRNVPEYYKTQEILDTHHCGWKTILEEYDTTTANGRMVIGIMLSIAQQERERTSERIIFVRDQMAKRGACTFGGKTPPAGYIKQKVDGITRLVKDPETQEAYEAFWRTMVATHNQRAAARVLADHGIIKHRDSIRKMVHDCTYYYGEYKGNPDFCEPYITRAEWDSINQITVKTPRGRINLFTGLINCCDCGHRLQAMTQVHTNKAGEIREYTSYRCHTNYMHNRQTCHNSKIITEMTIERHLLEHLSEYLDGYALEIEQRQLERKKKNPDISRLKEKLRRINAVYISGNMSDDEYHMISSDIKKQIQAIEATETPPERSADEVRAILHTNWKDEYSALSRPEKQRFWRELLSEIYVDGRQVIGVSFRV